MKLNRIFLSVILAFIILFTDFGMVANASTTLLSTTNIVLGADQKEFELDITVNNDGKHYSGAEFGINLNGVEFNSFIAFVFISVKAGFTSSFLRLVKGIAQII